MDLFKILMLEGKINEAVKVNPTNGLDFTLIEKMRYMAKSKGVDTGNQRMKWRHFGALRI